MSLILLMVSMFAVDEWRFELQKPAEGFYVVFFTAKWCGPCQQFKRSGLPALQASYPVKIIDIDEEPRWKKDVDRYPTFWLCRKSDETRVAKWTGSVSTEQIQQAITKATELDRKPTEPPLSSAPTWDILPQSVVALEGPFSRFSGVVIAPDLILTCAHHGESTGITATIDGRDIECAVIRSDVKLDLCLLRLSERLPEAFGASLAVKSEPAVLAGYLRGTDPKLLQVQRREGVARIRGVRVLPLVSGPRPDNLSGMSGGPVFDKAGNVCGILRCADKTTLDAADIDSIRDFLKGQ